MLDSYQGADEKSEDAELQKLITFAQSKSKYQDFDPAIIEDGEKAAPSTVDLEKEITQEMDSIFQGKQERSTESVEH